MKSTLLLLVSLFLSLSSLFAQDGALDLTFNSTGYVTFLAAGADYGKSVAIQPDGKILVGGDSDSGYDFTLVRYTATTPIATTIISPPDGESSDPLHYLLEQNQPNPFNNTSTIGFSIQK